MNQRSTFGQLAVFVVVLIVLNVVFRLLGLRIQFSIIGSVVLTLVVGVVMAATSRRS